MSDEFEIPRSESAVEALKKTEAALEQAKLELEERAKALQELAELQARYSDLESKINDAKISIYGLLHERLRRAEADCLQEYSAVLTSQVEALDAANQKGKPAE